MLPNFEKIIRKKSFNQFIIVITIIITTLLILTTYHLYNTTLEESKISHQNKQHALAKSAAVGIINYFHSITEELNQLVKESVYHNNLSSYKYLISKEIINSVFIYKPDLDSLFFIGSGIPHHIKRDIKIQYNGNKINTRDYYYSEVMPRFYNEEKDSLLFYIAIRNISDSKNSNSKVIGFLLSFDWLINHFIKPLKLTDDDFAWVLDSTGRLIFHPSHEEMILRTINEKDSTCNECHESFNIQSKMLTQKSSVAEYYIIGEPTKIMAFVPIELNDKYWILAISTYLPSVIKNVRYNFILIFILSGLSIILISLMGYVLYKTNLSRVRAEVSERQLAQARKFQEKINHAAKLASIGELVDNVAHEINTPTGIISAETDVLMLNNCEPKYCCEELEIIKKQTKRIKDYTKSLLNYSKRMPFLLEENNITKIIDECIFLLSPRLRSKGIEIIKNIQEDIPKFKLDKNRIEQVIINLLNNAIDASFKGGKIYLNTRIETNAKDNPNLLIELKDNGIGIPKENLDKIFEPFFSTKSNKNGTGLGLSISKAIVKRHNGTINVDSTPNLGTKFSITIPQITRE